MKRTAKYNWICAGCASVFAVIFQIAFCLLENLLSQIVLIIFTAALSLVPYLLNLRIIRGFCVDGIKRFILSDLLFVIVPVIIFSVISEAVVLNFAELRVTDGMGTVILVGIVLLEALVFWLLYFITNKIS